MFIVCGIAIDSKNSEKFQEVYNSYAGKMFAVALNLTKNKQDAEDVLQQTLISVYKNISKIDSVTSSQTSCYLVKATKNAAINLMKKRGKDTTMCIDYMEIQSKTNVENDVEINSDVEKVYQRILSLDMKYRDVLSLHYINHFKTREIAKILKIPNNTVKTRLVRGRNILLSKFDNGELNNETKQ